jgi:hypothetical protein
VDVIRAWLERVGFHDVDALLRDLALLPGRPVYPGPHADRALASFEWSVRGAARFEADRFAYSVDPEQVAPGAVLGFLTARAAVAGALADVIRDLHGAHFQIGLAGMRAKLYVYARGAPPGALDRVLSAARIDRAHLHDVLARVALTPAFVALDLPRSVERVAAKVYLEHEDVAHAVRSLRALGHDRLAASAVTAEPDWGTAPARVVVSLRMDETGPLDTTLHVKIDRVGVHASLVPSPLRAELARLAADTSGLGLVSRPTYFGELHAAAGSTTPTLYHRLVRERSTRSA